jgi:cytochrome c5
VRATKDGAYPGLVAFVDVDGESRIGITCAICHVDVVAGDPVVGRARRAFDYGALRLAYEKERKDAGAPLEAAFARRMRTWGPGRADVTEDDDDDPVAIPDLWGLRHQTFLTQAGTIKHTGPAALAIRQETQLLTSNHQRIRPPRELAFALAMYLYSLAPPTPSAAPAPGPEEARAARGKALYKEHCTTCHSNAAGGGDAVSVERVGTDRALANGAARGTGHYRPPALIRVGAAGPYFHDGSVATLQDVFSAERLEPSFARGFLGPGRIEGHAFGTELPAEDSAALVAYLSTM